MGEIILIGTAHLDPQGERRLKKLLEYTNPEILTLESSKKRRKALKKTNQTIKGLLQKKGITACLIDELISTSIATFFEWEVSKLYSETHKIPLYEVDLPKPLLSEEENVKKEIKEIEGMFKNDTDIELFLTKQYISKKDPLTLRLFDALSYTESGLTMGSKIESNWGLMGERDAYMAEQIMKISKKKPEKKLVHVGGALHAFKSEHFIKPSLYILLSEKNPNTKVYYLPYADTVV